jgi:hypothetical protein
VAVAKRYVLLMADKDLTESESKYLGEVLERRHGKLRVIQVQGVPRAVIVKTTQIVAPLLREQSGSLTIGGKRLRTVLTSGAIGNLKRRAKVGESTEDGEVLQR